MNPQGQRGIAKRVGEVVEASTTGFTAQCYTLYEAPPLGSLVRTGERDSTYGIVYDVATRSMDPARHPLARGRDEDTEEAVYLNNPQLSRLLLTEFRSLAVGHQADGTVRRHLAPLPPRIHSFVYECPGAELQTFTNSLEFLPLLLASPIGAQDDVIASFLRLASRVHLAPEPFLVDAGRELAGLFAGQLSRLNNLLRTIST